MIYPVGAIKNIPKNEAEEAISLGIAVKVEDEINMMGATLPTQKVNDMIDNKTIYNLPEETLNKAHEQMICAKIAEEILEEDYSRIKTRYLNAIAGKYPDYDLASEILVEPILKKNKIYTTKDDEKSEMYIYQNGIYVPQGKCCIEMVIRQILQEKYTVHMLNRVIAKIKADTYIEPEEFYKIVNIYEVPVQNGILNIISKTIRPFTPDDIFLSKLPIDFNPDVKCPAINKFLGDVMADESDREVFYELGGFALLREYRFEKAFMFVGDGRNGKGKTLELLKRVLGPENCYSLSLSALRVDNADIHQLHNKFINLAGDISNTDLKETGMFKSLTGRDPITSKRKFLKSLTFVNHSKFVFACNELPMVYDTSSGFWDRWVLVEFPYYFATQSELDGATEDKKKKWKLRDEDIVNKIATPEELSGLLNKFLEGLERLLKSRRFSSTKGTEDIKNTWIRKSNSFMAFCMDCLEEDYDSEIRKKDMRKNYATYCKKHQISSKSDFVIKKVLQELYGVSEESHETFGGNKEWYWIGVKWKK